MKSAEHTKKRRGGKAPRGRRKGRAWLWLSFVVLFAVVCAVVGYLLVILNGERILSNNIDKLNDMEQSSRVVDAQGNELAKLSVLGGNREYIMIKDIPKKVQQAFVAVEDKRFYEHGGVDIWGIGRALVKDVIARSAVEGASTITQQVARNIFLNADKTIFRKGTEASIALALENHKSKDEILELYLNRIYFGKGNWGIKTAAKYYFGVDDLNKLTTAQIAILAGIPKAPSYYNPISNPDRSLERRGVVLSLMEDQGLIDEAEKQKAMAEPYEAPASTKKSSQYTTFIDYVVDEAQEVTGKTEEELLTGGYTIQATIDTGAQKAMESAFENDANFEKSKDEIPIQGAMVIMDQHDGSLKAMVGGRDYAKKGWNRVTKGRQPGSSFKPIVSYGPALETGDYFPWSILRDDKICYNNGKYCPTDSNKVKYIGPVSMADAIRESRNQPAVWLLNEIGVKKGVDFAAKLGIELGPDDRNLAIALGGLTNGVSPLQMARAYGAFANGGTLQDPHSIEKITDSAGKTVYQFKSKAKQVMDPKTAYYVTEIMKGVVANGTGVKAKISGRTVAGKTGTTQLGLKNVSGGIRDIWFVGYTPEWTAAVWMGYDVTDENHYVKSGSSQAAALFSKVMAAGLKGHEKLSFPKPESVQDEEQVKAPDAVSGLMANYDPDQPAVELNWTAVDGEGITYNIYRKSNEEAEFKLLAQAADPAHTDFAILPDMTYTYYVTAYDPQTKTEGTPSPQVSVTISTGESPPPDEGTDGGVLPGEPSGEPGGEETVPPEDGQGQLPDDGQGQGQGEGDGQGSGAGDGQNQGQEPGQGQGQGQGQGSGQGQGQGQGQGSGQGGTLESGGSPSPSQTPPGSADTGVIVKPANE
ncbi:penicillin-binding protein 1F [Cohnella xylanilytica]|uniref:PBP1A family penicillin-binding protein n=1 Tax=Cohnella xylanilytica TaxID=557555 RepID=UPI001B0D7B33|nr:PBP1A family penicillin-binding protein [Cohnella xylanilytica]GIO11534.1 penicillin-binding protein 1F [Cohnella xylanilytica]